MNTDKVLYKVFKDSYVSEDQIRDYQRFVGLSDSLDADLEEQGRVWVPFDKWFRMSGISWMMEGKIARVMVPTKDGAIIEVRPHGHLRYLEGTSVNLVIQSPSCRSMWSGTLNIIDMTILQSILYLNRESSGTIPECTEYVYKILGNLYNPAATRISTIYPRLSGAIDQMETQEFTIDFRFSESEACRYDISSSGSPRIYVVGNSLTDSQWIKVLRVLKKIYPGIERRNIIWTA